MVEILALFPLVVVGGGLLAALSPWLDERLGWAALCLASGLAGALLALFLVA
ncbi:MAG: hypothetical protein QN204_04965 [Armatimonadota bacterium]|nr:hypothetical protein [Armatimonadota bacterium]